MVTLLAAFLAFVIVSFLIYPIWSDQGRTVCSQELLDRVNAEIEDEVRALRMTSDE